MGSQFYFDEVLPSEEDKSNHKVQIYTHGNNIHLRIWSIDDETEEGAASYVVDISKSKAHELAEELKRAMQYLRWL